MNLLNFFGMRPLHMKSSHIGFCHSAPSCMLITTSASLNSARFIPSHGFRLPLDNNSILNNRLYSYSTTISSSPSHSYTSISIRQNHIDSNQFPHPNKESQHYHLMPHDSGVVLSLGNAGNPGTAKRTRRVSSRRRAIFQVSLILR